MSTFQIEVPANSGLLSSGGEVFRHDPKTLAEIRFTPITINMYWDDVAQKLVQIDHIVTDVRGQKFVFTSFVAPYFFWEQMYVAELVAISWEPSPDRDRQQKLLVENLYFYWDGRERRALRCSGFPSKNPPWAAEKIFPVYEKHLSPTMNLVGVEYDTPKGRGYFMAEFRGFGLLTSTDGTQYGLNDSDKLCYRLDCKKLLWRHFIRPVLDPPGSPGNPNSDSYEYISPFEPVVFGPWKG